MRYLPYVRMLEIPRRCILATTDHGEIVLDPFAGSGTTGIAAAMEGRKAILIEKDPAYCEVIRKRVRELNANNHKVCSAKN